MTTERQRFRFKDCRICTYNGNSIKKEPCRSCEAGENFEERLPDMVDVMSADFYDNGMTDYD
jgi:hypothetical protein